MFNCLKLSKQHVSTETLNNDGNHAASQVTLSRTVVHVQTDVKESKDSGRTPLRYATKRPSVTVCERNKYSVLDRSPRGGSYIVKYYQERRRGVVVFDDHPV